MTSLLSAKAVAKSFGGARALTHADFELAAGEVHALFGSNGAGKSTLARIVCGHIRPDAGTLTLSGEAMRFKAPRDALKAGIAIVTQETNMAPDLSAFENVLLPLYGQSVRFDRRALRQSTEATLERLGLAGAIPLDDPVRNLTPARRQMLEIARALTLDARILIFDEPTTALSPTEVGRLFEAIDALRREGRGIVFVSHRLEELFAVTDRITVLRDGRTVALGRTTADLNQSELIRLMVGREVATLKRRDAVPDLSGAPVVLEAAGIGDGRMVRDVSFTLRRGEILGLGGLVGAGRSETVETLFGLRRLTAGTLRLHGKPFAPKRSIDAILAGIGYIAEDRRRQSIIPDFSVMENLTLSDMASRKGWRAGEKAWGGDIRAIAGRLDMPLARLGDRSLLNFSGGMQQKILLMRCLLLKPGILLLDEPTKGVDVAARAEIYDLLRGIARDGVSMVLVSSDFEELLALADTVVPISDGRSLGSIPAGLLDEEKLTLFAAPRSSAAAQVDMLNTLAAAHRCASFWVLRGDETLTCLATSSGAESRLGFSAGSIAPYDETRVGAALRRPEPGHQPSLPGETVLLVQLLNPRGHDLGWMGFLFDAAAPVPAAETLKTDLAARLGENFGHQIRIAS